MRGIIVLEGSDGTGKTTLAKHLVKHHGAAYLHQTYRWKDRMHLYHAAVLRHAIDLAKRQLVVIDRWWLSECVYAEVFRGGTAWPHMGRLLDRVFQRYGIYVVCLAGDMDLYQAHFKKLRGERPEMYDNVTKVAELYDAVYYGTEIRPVKARRVSPYHHQLMRRHPLYQRENVLGYTINDEGTDVKAFCERAVAAADVVMAASSLVVRDTSQNAAGSLASPRYLFLGDELSKGAKPRYGWPFFSDKGCSQFLSGVLADTYFDEAHAAWVNINEPDGISVAIRIHNSARVRTITLGERAFDTCRAVITRDVARLHHPQYYRRFHYHDGRFNQDLEEALR